MSPNFASCSRRAFGAVMTLLLVGCPAIYPELSTKLTTAPKLETYDPPPPPDRYYFMLKGAKIPNRTRDGRNWDQVFGKMPDAYCKVYLNDKELFRTDPQSDTLTPTWPDAPRGNFPLKVGDTLKFEVWDRNALNDHPIGQKAVQLTPDMIETQNVDLTFESDLQLTFHVSRAKPVWGVGMWYELRTGAAYVTRLIDGSPASRAGLRAGDRIVTLQGKQVDAISSDDVRGLMSTIPVGGLRLAVVHDDGGTLQTTIKEGPIYPLFADYGDPEKTK